MTDATLARIEDHLRRIADALERIPAVTVGEFTLDGCDDRTCTDRDHWAPTGRISHGSTPTTCVHGQDHPDDLECEYHDKPLRDGEFQVSSLETGRPVRVTVMNRKAGAILFDGDTAKLPADLDLPQGGWSADDLVQPMADPLDENDHRPRHDRDGLHLYHHGPGHWHAWPAISHQCVIRLGLHGLDHGLDLSAWSADCGPLTFCDCNDAATIEAENGATD